MKKNKLYKLFNNMEFDIESLGTCDMIEEVILEEKRVEDTDGEC